MIKLNFNFRTATGIYIGTRGVYIAQLKGALFGVRLIKFGRAEIQVQEQADEADKQKAKVAAIKRAIRENNITVKKVVVGLSGKDVLIRYFQLPSIPKPEWRTAISLEARRYIPFKLEELHWDFSVVLPKARKNKMDVTFVAVKKEVTERYLSFLDEAGLKPLVLEPAPFGLLRFFASGNQLAEGKPTAIVDIDYGIADINIVKDRICYLTRDVSLPLEEEVVFDNLLNEIRMSLDYYEKLFPTEAIGKVLLCGEVGLKDWDSKLAQELKLPVEKADPAKIVRFKKVLPPLNMVLAIGLALRSLVKGVAEVNLSPFGPVAPTLLPTAKPLRKLFEFTPEIRQAVLHAGALSCIGLLILHLVMSFRVNTEEKELERIVSLRPEISLPADTLTSAAIEKKKEEFKSRLSDLDFIIEKRVFWTTKFNELPKVVPPGVWLRNLSLSDELARGNKFNRSLDIKGTAYHQDPARQIEIVTKLVSNLKENQKFSQGFKEIKLDSMTGAEVGGRAVKNFNISCFTQ